MGVAYDVNKKIVQGCQGGIRRILKSRHPMLQLSAKNAYIPNLTVTLWFYCTTLKNADFDQYLLITSEPQQLAKNGQLSRIGSRSRAFQRAIDEPRTLPLTPQRVAQKANLSFLWKKIQVKSIKLCWKVSLCENFQRQSGSRIIPLSNGDVGGKHYNLIFNRRQLDANKTVPQLTALVIQWLSWLYWSRTSGPQDSLNLNPDTIQPTTYCSAFCWTDRSKIQTL